MGALVFVLGCDAKSSQAAKNPPESSKLKATPPNAVLRSDLGEVLQLIRSGPTGAARIRLRKLLNQNPQDGQAAFLYGLSLHEEKRYSEARSYFTRALEHAPEYVTTHHFLGWCLFYEGELAQAETSFLRHAKTAPPEGDDSFGLGLIYLERGELDLAQNAFENALQTFLTMSNLKVAPREQGKTLARLGELAEVQGDLDLAAERLRQATSLFPDHYEAWHRFAAIERRRGNLDAATNAAEQEAAARQRVGRPQGFPE